MVIVTMLALGAASAAAEADAQVKAPVPAAESVAPPAKPADLSFDLFEEKSPPAVLPSRDQMKQLQALEHKVALRRRMLSAHQALGFTTLATLAATVIIGQLNYQDKYVNGGYTGRYEAAHLGLSAASTSLFFTTGALALFAPNPYPKPVRLDTALVHKIAMSLATGAMLTQVILGPLTVASAGKLDQPKLALGHLVTGWASFGLMAVGTLAYVF
jgi:hypothetical protein